MPPASASRKRVCGERHSSAGLATDERGKFCVPRRGTEPQRDGNFTGFQPPEPTQLDFGADEYRPASSGYFTNAVTGRLNFFRLIQE
jgi:hypothetical protein